MLTTRSMILLGLVVGMLAAPVAGCSRPATPPDDTGRPAASPIGNTSTAGSSPSTAASPRPLTSTADGLNLTVVVEPVVVHQGDVVTVTATLRNGGSEPATYASTGWGAASGWASVAVPAEPTGRSWEGIESKFKHYALTEGLGPGGVSALGSRRVDLRAACGGEGGTACSTPAPP